MQKEYLSAQKDFDKGKYHDVLTVLNKLIDVNKDPRHYALLGATLVKLKMKGEAAQAFQLAGEQASPHRIKYLREAMRLHFSNNDDISLLRVGGRVLQDAIADPEMAILMAGALTRQEMSGVEAFRKTLAASTNPEHRRFAVRSVKIAQRTPEENQLIIDVFKDNPEDKLIRTAYLTIQRDVNDYAEIEKYEPIVREEIARGNYESVLEEISLYNIRWCDDEKINAIAGAGRGKPVPDAWRAKRRNKPHRWSDKIRLGYISADLWTDHAVMKAFRGVLEAHDRSKFEITLFCNATDTNLKDHNSAYREAWGNIVRIRGKSDEEVAELIKAANIDVLIDLQGHTADTRVSVMNHLTAPVHATWLGYPGTVVNTDIDYLICDRTVVPETSSPNYYEKLCWMPETFFPNDAIHRPLPKPVPRRVCGIPDDAFIFSCFHSNWKYTKQTVDLWIRILNQTPESYLFLICRDQLGARANVRKAFLDAGISGDRILFGSRVADYAAYLDRIALTDLGLDTYPYNGHTTTSEKLWCGVPMLTYKGKNFASRVSESLLNAVGLPEMVCETTDDYVARAVHFYNHHQELKEIRGRLEENRFTHPLFDSERFCRHLETAYGMMVDRAKAGIAPDHFDVPALPPRTAPFKTAE
ncbi:putative O-linked N-acetylglucosamine transferase (SPINDLY family) [Neorhizobium alkalisoli]|uniref:Putative O-linked N-acetylglucosamine transferase (SPINDLY family) n=2 Tax=Neorhizobium alkalisoli TaxID=528178 RepID=A0A561QSI3_9HYPH|nr:putative O-linked N-acetylglucosamine transferase (SPINDLY family) [Neorhizobium alkalisoli]